MKKTLHGIANCVKQLKAPGCFIFILFFINFFSIAQPGIWEMKQSLGDSSMGRQSGVGFSIGNKGYFGTGNTVSDNTDVFKNDFWEYDPATNAWTQKANFGGGQRTAAMGFSIGNKGYVGTGATSPGPDAFNKDFWEYDPAANLWTQKADYGGLVTVGAVSFTIGNKGYVGTGANNSGLSGDFWEYDPETDAWTRKANFGGGPRYGAVGFSIGNKGYIGTGYDSNGNVLGNRKDFWEYDPATDTWTQKADFGGLGRSLATGFSIGSKGYLGTGDISPDRARFSDDFWEYDPATDGWAIKAYFGGGQRINATGFNIGSKGYLGFGGFTNNPSAPTKNDLWEYTPGAESQIITHVSTTTFCSGSSYVISYTTSGIFNADNIFTAQLSNASGSFTNPIDIGSVSSTVSGTINAVIPGIPGTNFHIRVISSSPAIIGSDDGTSYTIDPPPVVKTKNITVYLNAHGNVTITPDQVDNGSTGCGGLSYTLDKTTFDCASLGADTVTLTVKDANGRTSSGKATVTVVDDLPPVIKYAFAFPNTLCPADGRMKHVWVFYLTKDNCTLASTALSVTSNQPQNSNRPDWIILNNHHVKLRARRPRNDTKTIYLITITAKDEAGNESTQTLKVTVCGNKSGFNKLETYGIAKDDEIENKDGIENDLRVQVMPNPSQRYFTLVTRSRSAEPIAVSVADVLGRAIELRQHITANSTVQIGEGYKPGIYFAQVRQGNRIVTVRLVKQAN